MAIVCHNYKLLFVMSPRTACTAIGDLLCSQYGGQFLPSEDVLDSRGRILVQQKHSTLSQLLEHDLLPMDQARSYLKVATVRNPFDSLVSLYLKKRSKYQPLLKDPTSWVSRSPRYAKDMIYCQTHSFNAWVVRSCYRKAIMRLFGFNFSMYGEFTQGMDMVMRYESIERDLGGVFERAGMGCKVDIPLVNRTQERTDRNYRSHYSRWSACLVGLAYSRDLKVYGYQF